MNLFVKSFIVLATVIGLATIAAPTTSATSSACVNGNARASWNVKWSADHSSITVTPKKALCADTPVNFSSYVMPDNYNGKPFKNNPTATPQTIFGHTSAVAKKGSTQAISMGIKLPSECKNMQIDAYWGPKVSVVTPKGHGTIISAIIIKKQSDNCEKPVTPVTPVTPVEPETPVTPEAPSTPETPATPVQPMPEVLPSTGPAGVAMQLVGVTTLAGATTAYIRSRRA